MGRPIKAIQVYEIVFQAFSGKIAFADANGYLIHRARNTKGIFVAVMLNIQRRCRYVKVCHCTPLRLSACHAQSGTHGCRELKRTIAIKDGYACNVKNI